VGNKLWRIIALFAIILIAFLIGKIAKFILQKSATKFEIQQRPITSIIAGLGIGGLAIALAAQDTIKNFFGSIFYFSINRLRLMIGLLSMDMMDRLKK
jgi:hypothetical protein